MFDNYLKNYYDEDNMSVHGLFLCDSKYANSPNPSISEERNEDIKFNFDSDFAGDNKPKVNQFVFNEEASDQRVTDTTANVVNMPECPSPIYRNNTGYVFFENEPRFNTISEDNVEQPRVEEVQQTTGEVTEPQHEVNNEEEIPYQTPSLKNLKRNVIFDPKSKKSYFKKQNLIIKLKRLINNYIKDGLMPNTLGIKFFALSYKKIGFNSNYAFNHKLLRTTIEDLLTGKYSEDGVQENLEEKNEKAIRKLKRQPDSNEKTRLLYILGLTYEEVFNYYKGDIESVGRDAGQFNFFEEKDYYEKLLWDENENFLSQIEEGYRTSKK